LEDIQFIGAVGGFQFRCFGGYQGLGWSLYTMKSEYYLKLLQREDTFLLEFVMVVSCLMMELELINPEHKVHGK
jgi:phosphoribosylformylglycinamidine synthase